jgi:uncharacterized protein YecT (DUF1311 family)
MPNLQVSRRNRLHAALLPSLAFALTLGLGTPLTLAAQQACALPNSALCAHQTLQALNARMNALYRKELAATQGTIGERRLVHSQNLWRRYTNAECMFRLGPQRTGGPAWVLQQDDCLSVHVQRRTAELQSYVDCHTQGNCPALGPVWGGGAP